MDITISIPNRGVSGTLPSDPSFRYEVARLKLLITMNASPAGSSVTYNGTNVQLGNSAVVNTDFIEYQSTSGNQAVIDIVLFSDFIDSDIRNFDYSNANPREVSLTLNGGGTPTALRWAAYAAASQNNDSAYRRVSGSSGSPTAISIATTSPSLPVTNARLPLDIAFVMDRSGSMTASVAPGTSRFTLLKTSISQFIDALSTEITSQQDDRLALVWFETTATIENFPMVGTWAPKANWATVKNRVDAQTTANLTAMGDGISRAVKAWQDANSKSDPMLVVFTDGMQNAGQQIVDQPPIGNLDFFDIAHGSYRPLDEPHIPMGAIGIGVPASYKGTLQNIAKETDGAIYVDAVPGVLGFGFHTQLIAALKGNTLALLEQTQGHLYPYKGDEGPFTFIVGNDTPQLLFCLYWMDDSDRQALDLRIIGPDGSVIAPDQRVDNTYHTVQSIYKPEPGKWQVFVTINKAIGDIPRLRNRLGYPFYLSVMGNAGPFTMNVRHWAKEYMAGAEVFLVLELDERGEPMQVNKGRGRVTIEVYAPQIDIDELLNKLPMPTYDEILKVLGEDWRDFEDPLALKLEYYTRLGYLGPLIMPDKPTEVIVFDVGDGVVLPPEARVDVGGIAVQYTNTKYRGTYRFKVRLEMESEISGQVVRLEEVALALGLGTFASSKVVVDGRRYDTKRYSYAHLNLQIYDENGTILGPGYDAYVDVQAKLRNGRVEYIHNTDGTSTYRFRIVGLLPDEDPPISISAFGQVLRRARLSELVSTVRPFPPWWLQKLENYKRRTTLLRKSIKR